MKHLWLSSFCIILITSSCYCSQENGLSDWENVLPEQPTHQQSLEPLSTVIERKPLWGFPIAKRIRGSFSSTSPQKTSTALPVIPTILELSIPVRNISNNSFLVVDSEQSSNDTVSTPEIQIITLDTLKKVKSIEANLQSASTSTTLQIQAVAALLSQTQKPTELQNMVSSTFTDNTSNTEITDAPSSPIHSIITTPYSSHHSSSKKTIETQIITVEDNPSLYELCFGCCIKKKAVKMDNLSESTMSNDDPKKKAELIELTNIVDAMIRI